MKIQTIVNLAKHPNTIEENIKSIDILQVLLNQIVCIQKELHERRCKIIQYNFDFDKERVRAKFMSIAKIQVIILENYYRLKIE